MRACVVIAASVLAAAGVLAGSPPSLAGAGSLADDGRAGVVADLAGTVLVRPQGRTRWSPVGPRSVLLPGDEVRTLARGAHAVEIRLAGGGSLVVGPASTVRLESRTRVRLVEGDAEVAGPATGAVVVSGPGAFEARVEASRVLRAGDGATSALAEAPRWLTGYRASTTEEWMGSLVANVDGRNVPLTVGYHKVRVTIRDQIAETTIEESFVNSTHSILEGVFSFPLPADASISGFGMWVGNELVEADIVEKTRAREIYEDIRNRNRDPGLLEWSGGNLFKASVFPIPAMGEKRIKLRYTQVLPLEGSLVRYRYALRSELLRVNPLRELAIHVAAQSATPIVSASSPTHEVRVTQDATTASIDFSASQFTPDRDFEVVLRLDASSPLRVVPHRRGDDGYFMLLVAPPDASAGAWKRELLPDGDPLDVLFVADTSGSMGPAERRAQRAFIESSLSLMSERDRFRLMACDSGVVWLAEEAEPATDENAARALDALDRRISLGWSDLDAALTAACEQAGDRTLVIYVGDGIGTTGDADPVALVQRIGRMKAPAGAAFHAVAPGASYEKGVLEAIAARGGSVRNAGDDPARAAYALLAEAAQPMVKDLDVAFEGLRTARVYPERLPNLAAGTQQIVLGRFLPEGAAEQHGRVTVSGTLAGKPVRYAADIAIAPGAEGTGNSFLPRLWARRHLDALLAEGRTPAIQAEVIAMSESYGIITPYTSFLVLENDEDRARYGVTRRVAMRDGERFFTDARSAAATAALRAEMQKARSWRLGLRNAMLAEIAGLGRDLPLRPDHGYALGDLPSGSTGGPWTGGGGGGGDGGGGRYRGPHGEVPPDSRAPSDPWGGDGVEEESALRSDFETRTYNEDEFLPASDEELGESDVRFERVARESSLEPAADPPAVTSVSRIGQLAGASGPMTGGARGRGGFGQPVGRSWRGDRLSRNDVDPSWIRAHLFQRFPALAAPVGRIAEPPAPAWDAEVSALLGSIVAPESDAVAADARLHLAWREGLSAWAGNGLWPTVTARALVSPERWLVTSRTAGFEPYEQWLDRDRGILAAGTRLGRRRPASEGDRGQWAALVGRNQQDFRGYATAKWTAKIDSRDGDLVVVALTAPLPATDRVLVTIDTVKRMLVLQRTFRGDTLVATARWGGVVRAGGLWWATEYTVTDTDGRETYRRTLSVREIPAAEFDTALAAGLAGQDDVIFLGATDPAPADAKQAVHEGRGTFADHLTIAAEHGVVQRWDEAWSAWEKARALVDTAAARRPGADWIEATLLSISRRGERFASQLRALAEAVATRGGPSAHGLARQIDQMAQNGMQANERLELLDVLTHAVDASADTEEIRWQADFWTQQRARTLANSGRQAEAVALWRELWTKRPEDAQLGLNLVYGLANSGDVDGALEFFRALDLTAPASRGWHAQQVYSQVANLLWNAGRFETLGEIADRFIAARPQEAVEAYADGLSALLALGRIEEFDAWVGERLDAANASAEDPIALAQLRAAVQLALGHDRSARWYGNRSDPKWVRPLALLARRLARDEKADTGLLSQIVNDYRWRRTDGHRELLAWLREDLVAAGAIESLPVQRLWNVVTWLAWDRNAVDAALWRGVTDRVKARLAASTEDDKRPSLLATALHLLDAHLEPEEAARVLRDELAVAAPARVPQVANDLATRLLAMPWTQAIEDEAFALVPRLVTAEMKPWQRRSQFATAARWLVDRLLAARAEAALPPHVEREKLPRAELREKQRAARTDARRALASRLAAEAKGADAPLRPWYEIERLGLAAELGAEAQAVEAETRELLLSLPAPGTGGDASNDIVVDEQLTWVLRERCVLVLSYLATRLEVPEGLADRVLALFRERGTKDDKSLDWRYATFRLLVALDRAADLETSLRAWIVPAHVESRWRRALGYLLAETGRVREAAGEFEEVARLGEMSEAEYVSLAGWYLVLGEDARREATLERRYSAVDEYALEQRIYRELNRVQSKGADGVPRTMDDEILRVIRALLAKSSRPEHVLHQVRSLYQSAKDFRLLASLADGVVGHTPQRIYPFLTSAASLVQEIHEEATCDELRARIEERVASARTDTDRRGLGLMMVLVERRAAEVLNQPGPHAGRALEDLKRARRGAWLPGERRLMADFLASLGKIPDAALAAEQASQLTEIHGLETPGTTDRLRVAHALFRTHWAYGRAVEAIDGLTVALEEHRRARGGVLPAEVNDLADALAGWHESHRSFKSGESWLAAEAARQTSRPQQEWYARRTFQLWVRCLQHGGTVSLGSRAELYRAARPVMERALADHAPDRLAEVLASYCGLHRAAHHNAKIAGVGDELVRFSRTLLPEILRRFGQQGDERLREVAEAINEVAGPLAALSLAVERLEQEPAWHGVRGRGYGTWQALSWQIAKWRREAGALGELEPRLLAVALRELERDLVSEEERGRTMFERNSGHFWAEKAGEFARIARKVIEEQPQAPGCVRHTAWYMFHGLGLRDEAERTLEAADGRGALAEDGRFLLVQWYQNEKDKRWRESLPHAERLVRERPDNLAYRIHNVRALHGVGRDDDGRALVDSTRVHFADLQARRQIDPGTSAQLANLCLDCGYFDRAVTLFPEAISERRRAVRGGQGDAELSQHYGGLARTLAGLGRYDEAVDAASSAVVVWGQDMDNRDYALRALRVAIAAIPDLAAWTARWEAAAAASGMDAPVIRLALADLHLDRNEPTQALRHLLVARRHTPDDAAVHAAVVKACEKAKDAEGTCDALATSLHHLPNQPDLYVKLADRLCGLGRTAEAERALTGLAEYAPNEADGHRRLALVRSEAGRHEDAVVQWRQVVRIRPSEVDGWFGLARSLAGAGQRGEAHRVLDDLLGSRWGADRRQDVERVSREIDRD